MEIYLPPSQSLYYADTEIDNGVSLLEYCIIEILVEIGELPFIIFGALNARTGNDNVRDASLPDGSVDDECVIFEVECSRRVYKDAKVNACDCSLHVYMLCNSD